jgi:hypothetical protein
MANGSAMSSGGGQVARKQSTTAKTKPPPLQLDAARARTTSQRSASPQSHALVNGGGGDDPGEGPSTSYRSVRSQLSIAKSATPSTSKKPPSGPLLTRVASTVSSSTSVGGVRSTGKTVKSGKEQLDIRPLDKGEWKNSAFARFNDKNAATSSSSKADIAYERKGGRTGLEGINPHELEEFLEAFRLFDKVGNLILQIVQSGTFRTAMVQCP